MKTPIAVWIRNAAPTVLVVLGVLAYVTVAGTTGSCPACAAITRFAGLPGIDRDSARAGPREGELAPARTAQTPAGKIVRTEEPQTPSP